MSLLNAFMEGPSYGAWKKYKYGITMVATIAHEGYDGVYNFYPLGRTPQLETYVDKRGKKRRRVGKGDESQKALHVLPYSKVRTVMWGLL